MVPSAFSPRTAGPRTPGFGPPTSMWALPCQGRVRERACMRVRVCVRARDGRGSGGGSRHVEDETLCQLLNLPSETREDRTKRLFRHYTVGSYDSLSAHRYRWGRWAGG